MKEISPDIKNMTKTITLQTAADVLRECLDEGTLTQVDVSRRTGIPASRLSELKQGERRFTAEHDLRLCRFYSLIPGYFLNLQTAADLYNARAEKWTAIEREVVPISA